MDKQERFWNPNKDSKIAGSTLVGLEEVQVREWNQGTQSFEGVEVFEVEKKDDGKGVWKATSDPTMKKLLHAQGLYSFPSTTIRFVFENDNEVIKWEPKLGYRGNLKSAEQAFQAAAGNSIDLKKAYSLNAKADAFAAAFGGKELVISTPSFKMDGEKVLVIKNLLEEGWWSLDDIIEGRTGRKPIPRIDPETGAERSDNEIIILRAHEGFIARPYRVTVNGEGKFPFQGFKKYTPETASANEGGTPADGTLDAVYSSEEIPF